MKRSTRWMGLAGLLAGVLWSGAVYAQDITAFQNGHITFENTDTNLYYRIEFRPSLTGPGEWLADLPDNIKSADAEVTVPVGVFYRVAGSYEPFSEGGGGGGGAGTATEADLRDGKTAWVDDVQLTGTMPERSGHVTAQSSSVQFSILRFRPPAGYYPGTEDNSVQLSDSNFKTENIRTGVSIFGVAGSALLATGNASAGEVLAGRTFSSAAGASTGTMPNRTGLVESQGRTLSGTTLGFRPQPGYYSGDVDNYVTFTDASFVAGNIRFGANIFGLGGSVIEATGTAADSSVLSGQTFSRAGAANRTGSMPNRTGNVTAVSRTPSGTTLRFRPPEGYYPGTSDNSVQVSDANFTAANIRSGVSIFGKAGTLTPASGNAGPGDVRSGRTFSSDAGAGTGTMPERSGNVSAQERWVSGTTLRLRPQAGYYTGSAANSVQWTDANFTAANIRSGVSIFGVAGSAVNLSVPAPVPKTGQTTSYRTGDDGQLRKGVAWPSPRFTDNGNGTVTDNMTGLMWVKAPHDLTDNSGTKTWNNAIDFCNGLTHAGHSDWRLPNRFELESLLDLGRHNPALPSGHPFTGVQSDYYWSSSTSAVNTSRAWFVLLSNGHVGYGYKTSTSPVWPVRGGQ